MTYFIKNKNFNDIYKNVEEVYNICHVLKVYCELNIYTEEISYINPLIKHIYKSLDYIYAVLINTKR